MPSIGEKIYKGYWLGEYEHQILKDSWPWPEIGNVQQIKVSTSVGPPYDEWETDYHLPEMGNLYRRMNRMRIDLTVITDSRHIITEITPTIGSGTTGKLTLYRQYYSQDFDVNEERIQPCIIGRTAHQSIPPVAETLGFWVGVVHEVEGIEWRVKGG